MYATIMGAYAVDLLLQGKTKRVVAYKNGEFVDFDINEALSMQKSLSEYEVELAKSLSYNYVMRD
jgi:6-phosphofructokinase 1